jgi:4-hydroxy-2-oxoheptanedioate aldolase
LRTLQSLWADRPTIGLWHRIGTAQVAEIVGRAGFDWVCIDAQHGVIGESEVRTMLAGLAKAGCPGLVRTPWQDPGFAMRALDAGAHGILFPTVSDADEVRRAVGACKYPPVGYRSWAALGLGGADTEAANEATSCGVMIETASAVDAFEEIAAVDGLGFVFVGPDDLAISLGRPPTTEPTDEVVLAAIDRVRSCCLERGLPVGIYCGSPAMVRRWGAAGFTVLAVASDLAVLGPGASELSSSARLALAEVDAPAGVTTSSGRG